MTTLRQHIYGTSSNNSTNGNNIPASIAPISSDIPIRNSKELSQNPAAKVQSGQIFAISRSAIETGLLASVNTWLNAFPKGTKFAAYYNNRLIANPVVSLKFAPGKTATLDYGVESSEFHIQRFKADGLGGNFRIQVVDIPEVKVDDASRAALKALAQDPAKLLELQKQTVQQMLRFIEQSAEAAQPGYELHDDLKKMANQAQLDPIVLDVLRFIAQSRSDYGEGAFMASGKHLGLNHGSLTSDLSRNLSLHIELKQQLKEVLETYTPQRDNI